MPFRRKAPAGLTARLDVRVAPAEKEQLADHRPRRRARGRRAGSLTRAWPARRVPHGRHDDPGAAAPRWPAQAGPRESGGAYRQQTSELLSMLRAAVGKLAGGQ